MCINHGVEDQCKQKYTLDEIWSALAVHFEAKMEPFNVLFFLTISMEQTREVLQSVSNSKLREGCAEPPC